MVAAVAVFALFFRDERDVEVSVVAAAAVLAAVAVVSVVELLVRFLRVDFVAVSVLLVFVCCAAAVTQPAPKPSSSIEQHANRNTGSARRELEGCNGFDLMSVRPVNLIASSQRRQQRRVWLTEDLPANSR